MNATVSLSPYHLRVAIKVLRARGTITPEDLAAGRRLGQYLEGVLERLEAQTAGAAS